MVAQTESIPYQAKKDLCLAVLYHMEHFLNQLGHIALLLLWIVQCEDPDRVQKCANQILNQTKNK